VAAACGRITRPAPTLCVIVPNARQPLVPQPFQRLNTASSSIDVLPAPNHTAGRGACPIERGGCLASRHAGLRERAA